MEMKLREPMECMISSLAESQFSIQNYCNNFPNLIFALSFSIWQQIKKIMMELKKITFIFSINFIPQPKFLLQTLKVKGLCIKTFYVREEKRWIFRAGSQVELRSCFLATSQLTNWIIFPYELWKLFSGRAENFKL
jgi:hypothetical protein